ncbi:MAG: toprim domain-containing protein [Selenomonadaceae bacterium]|nr:toprim domain-containing protein [Selenomonadaceae bacterium]
MKKISDATIDRLKTISPESLVAHGIIRPAPNFIESKQFGYACPLCNSGGHDNKNSDGAGKIDANNRFYCHACENADVGGHKLSTIDLFALARNLQHESFGTIVRAMAAEFGGSVEEENFDVPRRTRRKHQTPPPTPKTPPAELELIRADLAMSDEPLKNFIEKCGGTWRGFTADFLIKHGVKMSNLWTPPKSRVAKKFATLTERILIPAGEDFYVARFCGNLDDYDGATREFIEKNQKLNAGSPKLFLSRQDVLDSDEPIFAVEGAFDALSCELAGYGAVALNGRGNGDLLVDALKLRQAEKEKMPLVIVLMDSDEAGRKAAPTLYDELISIGVTCCVRFLFDDVTKTDANDILVANGVDNLRERLESIVDSARAELDACTSELERRKFSSIDDETIEFLFQGYDAYDTAYARRLEKLFGKEIRWCDDEFWLTFDGTVWRRKSDKNAVLAPYCQRLADLLNEHKATKDEAYVAEKFQSARKHAAACACLKGFESVRITADDLDKYPNLLVARNGVIDLETGKLMDAAPELLLTQQCAAAYNPKCTDTTFADFLKSVMPDESTREAVKSFFGYGLTADVSAEKFLLIYGKGGNGKGVLLLTLRTLLGDFSCELPVDTILEDKVRTGVIGRATPEISVLANKRVGIVDELPRGGRMDIAKLNRLTGGDMIPVRKLYGEFGEIAPKHKLIMTGNYRPLIDDTRDAALLRRLIAVKFEQDFTKNPDTALKKKLLTDSSLTGALNVLVPAAVNFYRDGLLKPSAKMKAARDEYLSENDFVGAYLAEFYEFGANLSVKRKDLLKHMRENCTEAARYRDSDLAAMLAKVDGVTYRQGNKHAGMFYGIGKAGAPKQGTLDFGGEILSSDDYPPFD